MSDQIEHDVSALKARAEAAQLASQRAEVALEAASAEEERALTRLREEFGVSSLEEAEALLAQVDAQLSSEIASVRAALDKAEGKP